MEKVKIEAHASLIAANTTFGLGIPITKDLLFSGWTTPMGYMLARCVGSLVFFWVASLFVKKEHVPWRDKLIIMGGGLIGFLIGQALTALSLDYTTPVYYSVIATLTPVATMLCAALFINEKITALKTAGVIVGIAGALLMVFMGWQSGKGRNDVLGIGLAVLSLLAWAIYLIITKEVVKKYSPTTIMKWIFLASTICILPFSLPELSEQKILFAPFAWQPWAELLFIVLLATIAGNYAIPFAVKQLQATTVSVYTNLQPIIASFVAISIGQDQLTWDKPVALIMVLLSAWIVTKRQ